MRTPVIDFHVHLINYEQYQPSALNWVQGSNPEDFKTYAARLSNPREFVQFLRESGVDYAVVLAELSPITTGICTNEAVAAFCEGIDCLIPFASINPYLMNRPAKELEKYVQDYGFKGLKLYPTYHYFYPNDPMLYPVYAKAEELRIPVMLHTGSSIFTGARLKYGDPLYLDDVSVDFPDLNIILVHSGRGFWYDRAFFLTRLHENIYMEIAGLPPMRLLTYFPEFERNADKIIFGSDWPGMPDIKGNIEYIRQMPLEEANKVKILGGNAARILGLLKDNE